MQTDSFITHCILMLSLYCETIDNYTPTSPSHTLDKELDRRCLFGRVCNMARKCDIDADTEALEVSKSCFVFSQGKLIQ